MSDIAVPDHIPLESVEMCPSGRVLGLFMAMVPVLENISRRVYCVSLETYVWIGFGIYFIRSHAVNPLDVEIAEG
jgi:hypothetical protein